MRSTRTCSSIIFRFMKNRLLLNSMKYERIKRKVVFRAVSFAPQFAIPVLTRLPSSFLSRHTHPKSIFCVAVISRTEYRATVVQTLDRSIDIEYVPFFSKFPLSPFVRPK